MAEKLPGYFVQQQRALAGIRVLLKNANIRPSAGMITTNHPLNGGGIILSLGDPSDHSASILVDEKGRTCLWEKLGETISPDHKAVPRFGWEVYKQKEVIEWLKSKKNFTETHLNIPSDGEIKEMIAETMR